MHVEAAASHQVSYVAAAKRPRQVLNPICSRKVTDSYVRFPPQSLYPTAASKTERIHKQDRALPCPFRPRGHAREYAHTLAQFLRHDIMSAIEKGLQCRRLFSNASPVATPGLDALPLPNCSLL